MKLKKFTSVAFDWEALKEAVRKGLLEKGDLLEIEDRTWKVLNAVPGETFIWQCRGPMDEVVFNESGSNEYEGSDIQRYARDQFPAMVPEGLREMVTDEGFFPLSIEEIRKYLPTEVERIAADENGETAWYWLRSAYRGYASTTWNVDSSGYVDYNYAYYASRFAPACHLQAN